MNLKGIRETSRNVAQSLGSNMLQLDGIYPSDEFSNSFALDVRKPKNKK